MRDSGTQRRAHFTKDGGELPRHLRYMLRVARARGRPTAMTVRALRRLMIGRLPELIVSYEDGRRFRMPGRDLDYAAVFFDGEYEPEESAVIRALLRRGDFAIDVGANLGWYAILMSAAVGRGGTVWAFEPVPETRRLLEENLALNKGHAVQVYPHALGANSGEREVHTFRGLPHGHASLSTLGRSDRVSHAVPAGTLDLLLERAGAPVPALVKVDAEGAELEVLRGAERLLSSPSPPIWVLEVNRETASFFGYEPAALAQHLREIGRYEIFRISTDGLVLERDLEGAHGVNWACVPVNWRERADEVRLRARGSSS